MRVSIIDHSGHKMDTTPQLKKLFLQKDFTML